MQSAKSESSSRFSLKSTEVSEVRKDTGHPPKEDVYGGGPYKPPFGGCAIYSEITVEKSSCL